MSKMIPISIKTTTDDWQLWLKRQTLKNFQSMLISLSIITTCYQAKKYNKKERQNYQVFISSPCLLFCFAWILYFFNRNQKYLKLSCDSLFQRAFTACCCAFKVITLVWANHSNYIENINACSKRTLKTTVATQLKVLCFAIKCNFSSYRFNLLHIL